MGVCPGIKRPPPPCTQHPTHHNVLLRGLRLAWDLLQRLLLPLAEGHGVFGGVAGQACRPRGIRVDMWVYAQVAQITHWSAHRTGDTHLSCRLAAEGSREPRC